MVEVNSPQNLDTIFGVTTKVVRVSTVKLLVPGDIAYRELVTRTIAFVCKVAVEAATRQSKQGRSFADELVSAVGEAFNNIAIHSYAGSKSGDVSITIDFDKKSLRVELIDQGHSFDPSQVAVPDFNSLPESGMGMFIIRSFVDEVEYAPGPPNVLALTKFMVPG